MNVESTRGSGAPGPLGAFEANTNQRVSNGSQPSRAVIAADTSAFWGGFEDSDQTELRTGRVAAEVARSPQQQPTSQEALIGRLQQRVVFLVFLDLVL